MPLSMATPNTAMKPIAEGTDRYWPVRNSQQAADGGEGHVGQDQRRVLDRVERGVEQHEDEEDRDRHDHASRARRAAGSRRRRPIRSSSRRAAVTWLLDGGLGLLDEAVHVATRTSIWITA
jgi:hypothetical protein